ncbi:hypothetical protein XELAEV_18035590mg [Xenopus laevis]|uniref:Uncharacterized protein n=1 Tax=Xenopus laevis TaxID=8355 RepID=A0A974CG11_XENLA|nr:hypothetical protein XELAEV_18035590mg [Xenopus laevis]
MHDSSQFFSSVLKKKMDQYATGEVMGPLKSVLDYPAVFSPTQLFLIPTEMSFLSAIPFNQLLKAIVLNRWDPKRFWLHSFRTEADTEAAMENKSNDCINLKVRWKSKAKDKRPINGNSIELNL